MSQNKINPIEYSNWFSKYFRLSNLFVLLLIYFQNNYFLEVDISKQDLKKDLGIRFGMNGISNLLWACSQIIIQQFKKEILILNSNCSSYASTLSNLFIEGSFAEFYPQYKIFDKPIEQRIQILKSFFNGFANANSFQGLANLKIPSCIYEGEEYGNSIDVAFGALMNLCDLTVFHLFDKNELKLSNAFAKFQSFKYYDKKKLGTYVPILFMDSSDRELEDIESYIEGLGFDIHSIDSKYLFEPLLVELVSCVSDFEKSKHPFIMIKAKNHWPFEEFDQSFDPWTKQADLIKLSEVVKKLDFGELIDSNFEINKDIYQFIPSFAHQIGNNKYSNSQKIENLVIPKVNEVSSFKITSNDELIKTFFTEIFNLNQDRSSFQILTSYQIDELSGANLFSNENIQKHEIVCSKDIRFLFGIQQGLCLTGKNSVMIVNELFAQNIASMVDQYTKFLTDLKITKFRSNIPSANIILIYDGQNKIHDKNNGFVSSLLNNYSNLIDIYFPPDKNTAFAVLDTMFRTKNQINIMAISNNVFNQYLEIDQAKIQLLEDVMIWDQFSDDDADIVFCSCGDYATTEAIKALTLLKSIVSDIKIRFVNIAQLSCFGIGDNNFKSRINSLRFDEIFTPDRPIIFNYNGYAEDIKSLIFNHHASARFSLHGYMEKGSSQDHEQRLEKNKQDALSLALEALELASVYNKKIEKNIELYKKELFSL